MFKLKLIFTIAIIFFLVSTIQSQTKDFFEDSRSYSNNIVNEGFDFIKKSKEPKSYIGIGYSFIGFTSKIMSIGYPFLDTKSGDFVSELSLFYGYHITKALAVELEPSISFSRNYRFEKIDLTNPVSFNGTSYIYDFPVRKSFYAYPLAVNVKIFPFSSSKGFGRMVYIGGSAGAIYVAEEYDHRFTNNPNYTGIYDTTQDFVAKVSLTHQWNSLFRAMLGLSGGGDVLGYGIEFRYTIVPLQTNSEPFRTRIAKNANNIDITLRIIYDL